MAFPCKLLNSLCSSLSLKTLTPISPHLRISPSLSLAHSRHLIASMSSTSTQHHHASTAARDNNNNNNNNEEEQYRWKPMCLYHTQQKCTLMEDSLHLEKFNHDCSRELWVNADECQSLRPQSFDFFLVLDLEGKVEILEFPVLIIDAKTLNAVDIFHRFVRPSTMSEQRINKYIEGKYGKFGVDRVWHDTAISFMEVLEQFELWLTKHQLWRKDMDGNLSRAAFVTCGNWDLKTKVPQQCEVSKMRLPPYFMEWINLKDVYLNFYNKEARGMMSMMRQLGLRSMGSHHLGIDDTKNIARVLQHMLAAGALMSITARRKLNSPSNVEFLFKNRIK